MVAVTKSLQPRKLIDLPGNDFAFIFPSMSHPPPLFTRFAPSPTGLLHLGHAHAALFAAQAAHENGGRFLLRMEDIDAERCRPEFIEAIYEDLTWLGLHWSPPVRHQSQCMADYEAALARLNQQNLLYPCFCTRKAIATEILGAQSAPHLIQNGPDGPLYPGTCRALSLDERAFKIRSGQPFALRLNMQSARQAVGVLFWQDRKKGHIQAMPEIFGDIVLARKTMPTSYHLAVTVDDHIQGITLVTRGEDLFSATHIHRLLQALLGLDTPTYHHHRLLMAPDGTRLAKRNQAQTIRALRELGHNPAAVRHLASATKYENTA